MPCPRCGNPLFPQARQCDRCGLPLGDAAQGAGQRPSAPTGGWSAIDVPGARLPSSGATGGWFGQDEAPPHSSQWGASVPNAPDGRMAPPNAMMRPPSSPLAGRMGMTGPPMISGTLVPITGMPSRPHAAGEIVEKVGPGIVMQRGRLRILAPFAPTQTPASRLTSGLTQWVASDTGRMGDRVVLLELPLGGMPLAEASHTREAIAARLDTLGRHPALPRLLGAFSEQGHHFLVFEFVAGEFLSDRIARIGALPERQVFSYAAQILAALQILSRPPQGMIHGLIAPDTILISNDGRTASIAAYSPYALTKWVGSVLPNPEATVHQAPFSPNFSAPEVQRDHTAISARADLYSLGATLFFALTNRDNSSRGGGIFPPVRSMNQLVSPPVDLVVAKSLRVIPAQRYQHAADMLLDVQRAQEGESPTRDPLGHLEPIRPARTGQIIVLTGMGLLTAVLIVILIFVLTVHPAATQLATKTATPMPTLTVNPALAALTQKGEGLSTGLFIFDISAQQANPTASATSPTPEGAIVAELQGAEALRNRDFAKALTAFQRAVQDDPSNAEARIYLANTQIALNNAPFVTLDVAVSFEGQDVATSRDVLRGAALAQDVINSTNLLPNKTQLQIELASVGKDAEGAQAVTEYFLSIYKANNPTHALGVVSWAQKNISTVALTHLKDALTVLLSNGIPAIAPLTTTDKFPPVPDFFRLSPTNASQGTALALQALTRSSYAATEVIADISNVNDREVAFATSAKLTPQLGGLAFADQYDSSVADHGAAQLLKAAQAIALHGAQAVVFVGDGDGVVGLIKQLLTQGYTAATLPSFYVAPTGDSPALIGVGDTPTAQFARENQNAMFKVNVLALADTAQWQYLIEKGIAKSGLPPFFKSYSETYTPQNATFPLAAEVNAILSFDTINLLMRALIKANTFANQQLPQPKDLIGALQATNADAPFQGVSGLIGFDKNPANLGVPANRSLVMKGIAVGKLTNAAGQPLLAWKVLEIVGGNGTFCDVKNGCPPA